MDALELGNDSGSLLDCQKIDGILPKLLGWTRHLGLDQRLTGSSSGLEEELG